MKTSAELKDYANTCHALARKAATADERRQLLDMAATWMLLACSQERTEARAEMRTPPPESEPFCRQVQRSPPH